MKTFEQQLQEEKNRLGLSVTRPPKKKPNSPEENEVNIDLLLSQKRIRVRFKFDPGLEVGEILTNFGFQWLISPSKFIYEHDDTLEARKFLNQHLNADLELDCFEEKQPIKLEVRDTPVEKPKQPQLHPNFEIYQMQIHQLMDVYKTDKADLVVLAIDKLYELTFPN